MYWNRVSETMSPKRPTVQRRRLLKAGASGLMISPAVHVCSARATSPLAANDQIQIGVIGLGSRGYNLIDAFLSNENAKITAICDVDRSHYRDRPRGKGPSYGLDPAHEKIQTSQGNQVKVAKFTDYRELCAVKDLDAVVVATPDHWHAHCTLEALKAGKDVYCEKPVTHTFREGQLVRDAVAKYRAVFQTGSQQRSDSKFRRAVELVRNGHLGSLEKVEVGLPPGYDSPQGDDQPRLPPNSLDYEFWVGPAPFFPYMRARHHRWWRGHRAYGGGVLMDWIGHHNDIAHWAMGVDRSGPTRVDTNRWTMPATDIYNTPHHYEIRCEYGDNLSSSIGSRYRQGITFIGDAGKVFVTRGKIEASNDSWLKDTFRPGPIRVKVSNNHVADFIDNLRTRGECIAPADVAHRSITPGHLGYVSHAFNRPMDWDPKNEMIIGNAKADRFLKSADYRDPWA